jgi:hypothetical protein
MKTRILALAALFMLPIVGHSQKKLTDKEVIGTWKLVIVIDDEDEDDEDERSISFGK